MIELLKAWGLHIVATLALLQPWIIYLWKTFVWTGAVDIYETGAIEVGYSTFGPTVGLNGTLRAVDRDQFVRSIGLTVTKMKDHSIHSFEWGVFRGGKVTLSTTQDVSLELPSGFMLTTTQPYRYNILFIDRSLINEMLPHIIKVREEWAKAIVDLAGTVGVDISVAPDIRKALNDAYKAFTQNPVFSGTLTSIDRFCYWDAGEYSLEICVNTSRPDQSFSRKWGFEISRIDSDSLRRNSVKVLADSCGRNVGQYNFAFPRYTKSQT